MAGELIGGVIVARSMVGELSRGYLEQQRLYNWLPSARGQTKRGKIIWQVKLTPAYCHSCALVLGLLISLLSASIMSYSFKARDLVMAKDPAKIRHRAEGAPSPFADFEAAVGMQGFRMASSLTLSGTPSLSAAG
jgi:hypothetical protein